MEVPAKFKSALVGLRYTLLAFLIVATTAFLVSCGNTSSTKITKGPDNLTITLSSDTTHPGEDVTVLVTVIDDNGDPIEGLTVEFSLPQNTSQAFLSALSGITDFNGQATITYTAGPTAGGDDVLNAHIIIRSNGIKLELDKNATIAVDPTLIGSLIVSTGTNSLVADGSSNTAVRATLIDVNGAAVVGQMVNFSTTLGTLSSLTSSTNVDGIAQVILTAGTTVGNAVVAASAAGFSDDAQVAFIADAPDSITMSASPSTITPLGTSTVIVSVKDGSSNPVEGETIIFSIDTNSSGGSFSPLTAVTDVNGQATVNYTAGGQEGTDTIRARTDSNGIFDTTDIEVSAEGGGLVSSITLIAGSDSLIADGSSETALRATVTDINGQPAPNTPVAFTSTLGNILGLPVNTNSSGVAQVTLRAGTTSGLATIIAQAGGFSAQIQLIFNSGPPDDITIEASPSSISPLGSTTVIVIVEDDDNNPIPNETVIFNIPTNSSGGSFATLTVDTDINGMATVVYTAGATAGTDTVRARTASNGIDAETDIIVTPTAPIIGSIELSAGADELIADGTSEVAIRAIVRDINGVLVVGEDVAFSSTLGTFPGGSTDDTDTNGIAQVTLRSEANVGVATILAEIAGFIAELELPFVFNGVDDLTMAISPNPINPLDTTAVMVTLLDGSNNPIENETIIFSIPDNQSGGSFASLNAITDVNGQAVVQYDSGPTENVTDTLRARTASDASVDAEETVDISDTSPLIGSLDLITSLDTLIADGVGQPDTATLRATVTDLSNNPIVGQTVFFTTTLGTVDASAETNVNGIAQADLTAGINLGTATVVAHVGGFADQVLIQFIAGSPTPDLTLSASPTTIAPLGTTSLMVLVEDAADNPVANEDVIFSIPNNNSGGSLSTLNATTDINGQAVIQYMAGPATVTTYDTIRARAATAASVDDFVQITIDPTVISAPYGSLTLFVTETTLVADGTTEPDTATLRATLLDISSAPVEGATIFFTTTLGTVTASAVTNSLGFAQVDLTTGTTLGTATVVAHIGGFSAQEQILFVAGPPDELSLSASPTTVAPLGVTSLMILVEDYADNPVANEDVIFSIPNNNSGGSLSTLNATTDINGQAVIQYIAGPAAVTTYDTIRARVATNATVDDFVQITVDPATSSAPYGSLTLFTTETVLVADGSTGPGQPKTATLRATLLDISNDPVEGATIFFTSTLGTVAASAVTNSLGFAQVDLTAGSAIGTATAVAYIGGFSDQQLIQFIAGPPDDLTLFASPTTIAPLGVTSLMVLVEDSAFNPVALEDVIFSIPNNNSGGSLSTLIATTDINGQAVIQYTAGPAVVTTYDTIRARSVTSASVDDFVQITVDPTGALPYGSLTLTTSETVLVADGTTGPGQPKTAALRATLLDLSNDPIAGATVFFTTTLGTVASSVPTDAFGVAQADLTAGTALGTATAVAYIGGFSDQQLIQFVPGPPDDITIDQPTAPASVAPLGTQPVQVTVTDFADHPIVGETVNFSFDANNSGGSFTPISAVTDGLGQATVNYMAGPALVTSYDTIRATVASTTSVTATRGITVTGASILGSISVTAAASTLVADGTTTVAIWATVLDTGGDPVPGVTVGYITTAGTIAVSGTTDALGVSQVFLTSSTNLGVATITASIGGLNDTTTVTFIAGPATALTIAANPSNITADGTSTSVITAYAVDGSSNPVADGQLISFNVGTGDGSLSPLSKTTSNGFAFVTYTAGVVSGSVYINAVHTNGVTNSTATTLVQIDESVGSVSLSLDSVPLIADGINSTTVRAVVRNTDGNLVVNGTPVTFKINACGDINGATPAANLTRVATTIGGEATTILKSCGTAGQYIITATSGGITQVEFVTFIPGPADAGKSTINDSPDPIPADGTSYSTITVLALDATNNRVADGTDVDFYTNKGTLSDSTVQTANGVATVQLTSTTTSGDIATVDAIVDGVALQTTVGFDVVTGVGDGTATYIELTSSSNTIRVQGAGGQEQAVITATGYDSTGSLITDCTNNMEFSILSGPGGGEALDGSTTFPVQKTTSSGTASVSLTSGAVSGTLYVEAKAVLSGSCTALTPTVAAMTTPIAIEAGEPANIIIFQDNLATSNFDGSISQTFSALAQDLHGNPVENGTVVFFGLVDNPDPAGPPYLGYISTGTNGATSGTTFTSVGNTFIADGLMDDDVLIIQEGIDEGGHRIEEVVSATVLNLYNTMNGAESGLDFVAGSAELGVVCGSVQTGNLEMDASCTPTTVGGVGSIKGVAHTKLTWVPAGIFKPFHLYAESVGGDVGDTLADSYPGIANPQTSMTIAPSDVQSGTTGISVEATFKDGAGNPIQGQPVVFSSSNPGAAFISGSNPVNTSTNGKAATTIDTTACLLADVAVTFEAALGSIVVSDTLDISATAPIADFTPTSPAALTMDYADNSTTPAGTNIGPAGTYTWTFASGAPASAGPTLGLSSVAGVTYGIAGTYTTTMTLTNDASCSDTVSKSVTVP